MSKQWQAKICPQCNVNECGKGCRICTSCVESNLKARMKETNRLAREERAAARLKLQCKCGCGLPVEYPTRYATDDCREKARKEVCKRYRENRQEKQGEVDLAPEPAQRPVLTDEEQSAINRAAVLRDAANHAHYMRQALGLEVQAGKALASPVRHLSPEEIATLSQQYQPPQKNISPYPTAMCD